MESYSEALDGYCNLLLQSESINYGLYSSNWIDMDLKHKKLILLTMRMNGVNQIILKASPKKIINLQLFVNVYIQQNVIET